MHRSQGAAAAAVRTSSAIDELLQVQPRSPTTTTSAAYQGSLPPLQQQLSPWQSLDTPQIADQLQQQQLQLHQDFLLQGLFSSRNQRRPSGDGGNPASNSCRVLQAGDTSKLERPTLHLLQQQGQCQPQAVSAATAATTVRQSGKVAGQGVQPLINWMPATSAGQPKPGWPGSSALPNTVAAGPSASAALQQQQRQQRRQQQQNHTPGVSLNLLGESACLPTSPGALQDAPHHDESSIAAVAAEIQATLMEVLASQHQQQQQQRDSRASLQPQLPLPSAFAAAGRSAFAGVAAAAGPSHVTSSSTCRFAADLPGSTIIGRTVTGELPIARQDSTQHGVVVAARADSAPPAVQAAAVGALAAAADGAEADQQETKVLRHTRQITCKTYLKRLNVTQFMSDHLLPSMEGSLRTSSQKGQGAGGNKGATAAAQRHAHSGRDSNSAGVRNSAGAGSGSAAGSDEEYSPHNSTAAAGTRGSSSSGTGGQGSGGQPRSYELLFKVQVKLVDTVGQVWPITYEGVLCAGQRHLRLTCGWSEFIKAKRLAIGDSITFERRGANRTALAVAVQHAGQEAEPVYAGTLPEDEQVKVLIGSLRPAGNDNAGSSTAAAAGAGWRGANSGGGRAVRGKEKQRRKQQLERGLTTQKQHAAVKKRIRGGANDDHGEGGHDVDGDDSSGSAAQTDSRSGPLSAQASGSLGNFCGQLKEGLTALRVNSSEKRALDSSAAAVLGRPHSFTKRQNLSAEGAVVSSPAVCTSPADGSGLLLPPAFSSAVGRAAAAEEQLCGTRVQQQQQQARHTPWAQQQQQQQQQCKDQEAQLEWQLQPTELLTSWPASLAAAAAAAGDSAPPGPRRYLRQISHPVARRELQAAELGFASGDSMQQQQAALQVPASVANRRQTATEQYEIRLNSALDGRSRLATVSGPGVQAYHQQQAQEEDFLHSTASVPLPGAAATRGSSVMSPGWQVSTGFVGVSSATRYGSPCHQQYSQRTQLPSPMSDAPATTGTAAMGNTIDSPVVAASAYDSSALSSMGQQSAVQQQYGSAMGSPMVAAGAAGAYMGSGRIVAGHQAAVQQQYCSTAFIPFGSSGPSSTGGALPGQQQQQRGWSGSTALAGPFDAFTGPTNVECTLSLQQGLATAVTGCTASSETCSFPQTSQLGPQWQARRQVVKLEDVVDPRGVWNPQLLAPPAPRWQQQQQHLSCSAPALTLMPSCSAPALTPAPSETGQGLLYTGSTQMQDAWDENGATEPQQQLPPQQQQQQFQWQPVPMYFAAEPAGQYYPQQQQQHGIAAAATSVQVAAAAAAEPNVADVVWDADPDPFLQQQQQQQEPGSPDPDQLSMGSMKSDMLVDTLLQLLAEPSLDMADLEAGSPTQEQQQQAQRSFTEDQQALQQQQQPQPQQQQQQQVRRLQQAQQPAQQEPGLQVAQTGQLQTQQGFAGYGPMAHPWQQQVEQQVQQYQQQQQQYGQVRAQQPPTLLQQWQQQQQQRPHLAPPTLLPMEAVAAATAQHAAGQQQNDPMQHPETGFVRPY